MILEEKISVGVIGIGRIGLPTALAFADKNFNTLGIDINKKLVDSIKNKKYPLKDEPGFEKIFDKVIKNKKFQVTTDISKISRE